MYMFGVICWPCKPKASISIVLPHAFCQTFPAMIQIEQQRYGHSIKIFYTEQPCNVYHVRMHIVASS